MKSQITKIVSLLVCVCLIVSGMILSTSAAETTYTKIDRIADLTEGTYLMAAYKDGYQFYTGVATGSSSDCYTSLYTYGTDRTLTTTETYTAKELVFTAVAGKTNTYTVKDGNQYFGYSDVTNSRKIVLSSTPFEWKAENHADGGIILVGTVGTNSCYVGTAATASSKFIRGYKESAKSSAKGLYLFKADATGSGSGGNGGSGAGGTTSNDPADGSTLTIPEALALAESKDDNVYTTNKYYVEGEIKNVYNTQYGNMYIKDANGNELCIYGTYSADGTTRYDALTTKPVAGDTIKVYGVIGKYVKSDGSVTTLQMKDGWIITHTPATSNPGGSSTIDPPADSTLTIPQALEVGGTKEHNTYTSGKYYVEGVISSVSNEEYGNMTIKDANNNSLTIYGSYDADGTNRYDAMATKPVAGDTVKLYGIIGKYSTTVQMKNAWIVAHTPGTPPVNNDPAADTVLTVKAAAELGASKDHNAYTTGKYYVTGTIKSIASDVYGNMTIEDADGNELYVYGTWNEDGSVRYDALTDQPQVGDTVTVYGIIGQYNGTAQMKNGWFKAVPAGGNTGAGTGTGTGTGSTTGSNTNTNTGSTTTTTPAPEKSPETGDSIALYIVMMAISAAAMVLVAKKRFA